tara:strand:- start:3425 stop:3616 length:192 start_codon:yes stop_codon:yes gene_type:complete
MKIIKKYNKSPEPKNPFDVGIFTTAKHEDIPEVVNRATRRAAMSMKRKQSVANNHAETKKENN